MRWCSGEWLVSLQGTSRAISESRLDFTAMAAPGAKRSFTSNEGPKAPRVVLPPPVTSDLPRGTNIDKSGRHVSKVPDADTDKGIAADATNRSRKGPALRAVLISVGVQIGQFPLATATRGVNCPACTLEVCFGSRRSYTKKLRFAALSVRVPHFPQTTLPVATSVTVTSLGNRARDRPHEDRRSPLSLPSQRP